MGILDLGSVKGTNGQGVPTGGAIGQALFKSGTPDFVTEWAAVGRTNPNLLINGDFKNPVNTYGIPNGTQQSYSYTYIFPCWKAYGNIIWNANIGLTIPSGALLYQYREIDYTCLLGKAVTVSVKYSDGTYRKTTLTFPNSVSGSSASNTSTLDNGDIIRVAFEYRSGGVAIGDVVKDYVPYIQLQSSNTVIVDEMWAEMGIVSTHPYAPPMDYAIELEKCRRYCYSFSENMTIIAVSDTTIQGAFHFRKKMRTIPTIIIRYQALAVDFPGLSWKTRTDTTFSVEGATPNGLRTLYAEGFTGLSTGRVGFILTPNALLANAEI